MLLPLALTLAAVSAAPAVGGAAMAVALLEVGGAAAAEDRGAVTHLLDDALSQRGLDVHREGNAPRDCGGPCLDGVARRSGAELALLGELSASSAGLTLALGLYDPRRADLGVTRATLAGADLNALGATLGDTLDKLLGPALALRGAGPELIKEGLGWGTPGLILGGSLVVAGVTLVGVGSWPFVDRALGSAELERLRAEGAAQPELNAAGARVSAAHEALTEWGLTALSLGAGATLVGAAMVSAALTE